MRIGKNPAKGTALPTHGRHRIIVPIYIPNLEGYFEHALTVMTLCLESLWLTTNGRAAITVISNGSAPSVVAALQRLSENGRLDQLVLNDTNRGKVDAALCAARGSFEPFITFSDADVLFRPGWLDAVESLFRTFPETGVASPFTMPPLAWIHTSATLLSATARLELARQKVVADASIDQLERSLGHPNYVPSALRESQLVVKRAGAIACVGATHIVSTMRRELIQSLPQAPSLTAVAGSSEKRWIDEPSDRCGFWRLSTPRFWAAHMGNTPEPWMAEEVTAMAEGMSVSDVLAESPVLPTVVRSWTRAVPLSMRRRLAQQLQRASVQRVLLGRGRGTASVPLSPLV